MSEIKLSEIRARYKTARSRQRGFLTADYFYLLKLVERLGKVMGEMKKELPANHSLMPLWEEARTLLKELEL